jgi:hypothetical protein
VEVVLHLEDGLRESCEPDAAAAGPPDVIRCHVPWLT